MFYRTAIFFDLQTMKPKTYASNPDAQSQSSAPQQDISLHAPTANAPIEEQGFAGGGGLTWPEYQAAHPELPVKEALRRFKAIKRGQDPNANLGGGMHM